MSRPTVPLDRAGGDVTYPYFLIDGRTTTDLQEVEYLAGQRIRLRVSNAGADTAFRVAVPGAGLDVTHTDGFPTVPERTNSVILGMGERFDAIVTVGSSVPLIAAPEGKDGHAQLNPRVGGAQANVDVGAFVKALRTTEVLNTATLTPAPDVVLPQRDPDTVLDLKLSGPLAGYTWPINGKLYDPPNDGLAVAAGHPGAAAVRQQLNDVPSHALTRAHVSGGRVGWAGSAQGHGARPADEDRRGGLRHQQSWQVDRALP